MKFFGYVEPFNELTFTIPIYSKSDKYYIHDLSPDFRIIGFNVIDYSDKIKILENALNPFNIGDIAPIVFCHNYKPRFVGKANHKVNEIWDYLENIKLLKKEIEIELQSISNNLRSNDIPEYQDQKFQQKNQKLNMFVNLTGNEGKMVSLQKAKKMHDNYINSPIGIKSEKVYSLVFGKERIAKLLELPGYAGLCIFLGIKDGDKEPELIVVAINDDGEHIRHPDGVLSEGVPCPKICPTL